MYARRAAADVLDRLTSLVEKSLVLAAPTDDDGTRFALLATLHGYALERLTASGDLATLQRRHAAYYTDLAEPCLYLPDRAASLTLLDHAYDNLRAALTWATGGDTMPDQAGARAAPIQPHAGASDAEAATAGERGDAEGRGDLGLRLAGDLAMYWFLRGRLQEGQAWIERVVASADAPGAERTAARAWVLNGAGLIAVARGDAVTAVARAEESVAAFRELGDRGDKSRLAYAYLLLGTAHVVQGAPTAARAALEQGRIAHHEAGDPLGEVYEAAVLHYLGRAAHAAGDLAAARALYEQSLAIYRRIGDVVGRAVVLNVLGVVDAAQGESEAARAAFAESLPLVRTTGDRYDLAQFLVTVGADLVQRGDRDAGRDLLAEGLRLWRDIGTPAGIARALAGLADLAAGEGQADRAGCLFAAAARLSSPDDRPLNDTRGVDPDRTVAAARTASDDVTFKGGWSAGEALTEEEAIALALQDEGSAVSQ